MRSGSLHERLATAADDLAPVERRVVDFVSENADEVAFLSTSQLASRLGVSTTTVVRTAQALGYRGLSELRGELRDSLQRRAGPDEALKQRLGELRADGGTLLGQVLRHEVRMIEESRDSIPSEEFKGAVRILARGRRILVYAYGPVSGFAYYFVQWLKRLGRPAIVLSGQGLGVADDFLTVRRGDVLVVLAFAYVLPEVDVALERARSCAVQTVLITDTLALALRKRVTVALSLSRGGPQRFPFSAGVVAVLEALLLALAAQDSRRASAALKSFREMRAKFDAPETRAPRSNDGRSQLSG